MIQEFKPRNIRAFIFTHKMEEGTQSIPCNGLKRESWGWTVPTPEGHKNVQVGNYIIVEPSPVGDRAIAVEEAWRFLALYTEATQ